MIDTVPTDIVEVADLFYRVIVIDHHAGNINRIAQMHHPKITTIFDPRSKFGACMMVTSVRLSPERMQIVEAIAAADTWNTEYFEARYQAHPAEFVAGFKELSRLRKRRYLYPIWDIVLKPETHFIQKCISMGRHLVLQERVHTKRGEIHTVKLVNLEVTIEVLHLGDYGNLDHRIFIVLLMMVRSTEQFPGIVVFQSPGKGGYCSLRSVPEYAKVSARKLAEVCEGNGHDHAAGAKWDKICQHLISNGIPAKDFACVSHLKEALIEVASH